MGFDPLDDFRELRIVEPQDVAGSGHARIGCSVCISVLTVGRLTNGSPEAFGQSVRNADRRRDSHRVIAWTFLGMMVVRDDLGQLGWQPPEACHDPRRLLVKPVDVLPERGERGAVCVAFPGDRLQERREPDVVQKAAKKAVLRIELARLANESRDVRRRRSVTTHLFGDLPILGHIEDASAERGLEDDAAQLFQPDPDHGLVQRCDGNPTGVERRGYEPHRDAGQYLVSLEKAHHLFELDVFIAAEVNELDRDRRQRWRPIVRIAESRDDLTAKRFVDQALAHLSMVRAWRRKCCGADSPRISRGPMKLIRLALVALVSSCNASTPPSPPVAGTALSAPSSVPPPGSAAPASSGSSDLARDDLLGKPAPDFTATAQDGTSVHLASLRGKWVVVYFYPKDETAGCTKEACSFRDAWQAIAKTGAVLVGVSADSSESHMAFAQHYKLPFLLLTDPDGAIGREYGVPFEGHHRRETFVIGADGTVRNVYRKVDVTVHAAQILEDLSHAG